MRSNQNPETVAPSLYPSPAWPEPGLSLAQRNLTVVVAAVVHQVDLAGRAAQVLAVQRSLSDSPADAAGILHGDAIARRSKLVGEFEAGPCARNAGIDNERPGPQVDA